MRFATLWVIGVLMTASFPALSEEHPACTFPFTLHDNASIDELHKFASTCSSNEVADLFFNRAYHQELMVNFQTLSSLESYTQTNDQMHFQAQRIFIGLAEAFASKAWLKGNPNAIKDLNKSYDKAIEVSELLLRGNEILARQAISR